MNVGILLDLIHRVTSVEAKEKSQNQLKNLFASGQKLAEQPQNQDFQKDFAEKFKKFSASMQQFSLQLDDREQQRLAEINVIQFFNEQIVEKIEQIVRENSVSPAVIRDEIETITQERDMVFSHFNSLGKILSEYGFSIIDVPDEKAEMGFQIPRDIFKNDFDDLIKDLSKIRGIIQIFSEVSAAGVTEIKVHHISTSDPIFILAFDVYTIGAIGAAVTWALDVWRRVEEIRKLRADAKKTGQFSDEEIEKTFNSKINSMIDNAVNEKAKELKKNEETYSRLQWALRALLAYIERGLTEEIRLPPAKESTAEGEEGEEVKESEEEIFDTLRKLKSELKFIAAVGEPILALPEDEGEDKQKSNQ